MFLDYMTVLTLTTTSLLMSQHTHAHIPVVREFAFY